MDSQPDSNTVLLRILDYRSIEGSAFNVGGCFRLSLFNRFPQILPTNRSQFTDVIENALARLSPFKPWTEAMDSKKINLDDLLTPAEFGQWIGQSESWVRRRLASLPGVIRESRKHIRIHPRTYLEKRLRIGPDVNLS